MGVGRERGVGECFIGIQLLKFKNSSTVLGFRFCKVSSLQSYFRNFDTIFDIIFDMYIRNGLGSVALKWSLLEFW